MTTTCPTCNGTGQLWNGLLGELRPCVDCSDLPSPDSQMARCTWVARTDQRCEREVGHSGPHAELSRVDGASWVSLIASGRYVEPTPCQRPYDRYGYTICKRPEGHSGEHESDGVSWPDSLSSPSPASSETGDGIQRRPDARGGFVYDYSGDSPASSTPTSADAGSSVGVPAPSETAERGVSLSKYLEKILGHVATADQALIGVVVGPPSTTHRLACVLAELQHIKNSVLVLQAAKPASHPPADEVERLIEAFEKAVEEYPDTPLIADRIETKAALRTALLSSRHPGDSP